ncbi:MAG: leucyl/phenylalanyl-tRNA--protein transferase [Terrimicrobiaceae bacterium]|jgi:leucyl/phenylalanyl-tRNA--protein transferase
MANTIPQELLLDFYCRGLFPMAIDGELRLFSPDPRGILPLEEFRIPHGTRKTLRDPAWEIRLDSAFEEVMLGCAERDETWIDEALFQSYMALHRSGHAHSLEVWRDGVLAGGLYGVGIGGAFFGESMFHRVPGASKVALCRLVERMRQGGFLLLDTQWVTPHLEKFGAREIRRDEYLQRLDEAIKAPARQDFLWGNLKPIQK